MLVDRDLPPDELLVDGLGGLLDVALRQRVLRSRRLALADRRADGERQLHRLDDAVEQKLPLRGPELFRVLLRIGQRLQLALELLPHRLQHCLERVRSSTVERLILRWSCPRTSSSVDSMLSSPSVSSTTASAARRPSASIRWWIVSPWSRWISSVTESSSHFALPACRCRSSCASHSFLISSYARSSASSNLSSGTSFAPASTIVRPSSVPTTIRSSSVCSRTSGSVGLRTSSPSIIPIRTAPTGPMNGSGEIIRAAEAPLMQRMSCAVIRSALSTVQITCVSFL